MQKLRSGVFEQPFEDLGIGLSYALHLYLVEKPMIDFS